MGTAPSTARPGDDVFDGLLGAGVVETAFVLQPGDGGGELGGIAPVRRSGSTFGDCADRLAQLGDLLRKARRCAPGASPRQKGTLGGAPCASSTSTRPRSHAADAPGSVAEQHDVAGQALDGEILVHRADHDVLRAWPRRCRARFRELRRRW